MDVKKIVIALCGNALGSEPAEQISLIHKAARSCCDVARLGHKLILTHGNGPQIGMINAGLEFAAEFGQIKNCMPLPECGAMSQGYIGYHLQNALQNTLFERNVKREVATVITQVLVDQKDAAFCNPTKPIGSFYTKEQADILTQKKGYLMIEDAGRGYRRVVPSPKPLYILELSTIIKLINLGTVVICAGGGGIPVTENKGRLTGVSGVIDKDLTSAKLAELINADVFIIATSVDKVSINWGKPTQKQLSSMTIAEALRYCEEGQFAKGSMLPKIEAAIEFAKTGKPAIITSLNNLTLSIDNQCGTIISN